MLNFICSIPEEFGWALVGALMVICWIVGWKVGKCIYQAIKERIEEMREVVNCDEPSVPDGDFR
jgi:hypothetical protein